MGYAASLQKLTELCAFGVTLSETQSQLGRVLCGMRDEGVYRRDSCTIFSTVDLRCMGLQSDGAGRKMGRHCVPLTRRRGCIDTTGCPLEWLRHQPSGSVKVQCLLDNIIIAGTYSDEDEHVNILEDVLTRLNRHNIRSINMKKCQCLLPRQSGVLRAQDRRCWIAQDT